MAFSLGQLRARGAGVSGDRAGAAARPMRPWQFNLFHKLALIVALSSLPALLLAFILASQGRLEMLAAEKERQGLAYLSEGWEVFGATMRGQDAAGEIERLTEAGARYDEALNTTFYRTALTNAVKQGGNQAVDAARDFMQRVADNSGLSVDKDLSTLQAITIFTTRIPEVAAAAAAVADRASLGPGVATRDRMGVVMQFQRANRLLTASLGATDALNFEAELAARLGRAEAALGTSGARLSEVAASDAVADRAMLPARQQDFQAALSSFWAIGVEALDRLMVARIDYLRGQFTKDAAIGAAIALVLTTLIWMVSHSITSRLAVLGRAMEGMRRGRLDVEVPQIRKRDEIGAMARAVEDFRGGLIAKRKVDEALRRNQKELEQQNLHFDAAITNMSQGLALFDRDTRLIVANARFAAVYGLDAKVLAPGDYHHDIIERMLAAGAFAPATAEDVANGTHPLSVSRLVSDSFVELSDGRVLFVAKRAMPGGGWVSTHEDITERRQAEAKMAYMAHHDALTDLPNRVLFREKLEEAAATAQPGKWVAVLCLDLDNFKGVNDTLGHPVGDLLLKAVAERLRGTLPEWATVARLSGDEFAVLEPRIAHPDAAAALAQEIIAVVAEPFNIDGHQLVIGTSIGIAIAPTDGTTSDQLLKNADMALYRAKGDGRGTHRFFEREMDARLQARRLLEVDIRKALAADEFELYYQAQVNLARDAVSGFEALIRWHHPERGLVAPSEFIPLAEETGLIVPIGEWVIRTACNEAARWPRDIRIAVNLSPVQFRSRNLVPAVIGALADSGLAPSRLELEITESVLLENNEATLATLHHLRNLGVRISMDDFGTGYSSLSYLRSFPFDKIKIDRSFTRDIESTADSAAIVRAVASLGASLGITTTAEGVETERQLEIVRGEGCTEVQGYVYSEAIPASDVWGLLERFELKAAVA
jgi:diguanylate cyclase (GGDEF)-like protein